MPLNIAEDKKKTVSFSITKPKYSMEDLVLDDRTKGLLDIIVSSSKNWKRVFEDWNFKSVQKYQKSVLANFYGAPGTGKTMAAHAVANSLGKKILCVNYSEIESKFVGETSKNLVALFNFAKENDAIIFFDEADALLSKRVTDMTHSTDVSVNQTRSVLLTILNDYEGMVLFASNFIENFDVAFLRRIQYQIEFNLPNKELREKLWRRYIPSEMPALINFADISEKYSGISGSNISTAVLQAALEAASKNEENIPQEYFEKAVQDILSAIDANKGNKKAEVKTEQVSRDYVVSKLGENQVKKIEEEM